MKLARLVIGIVVALLFTPVAARSEAPRATRVVRIRLSQRPESLDFHHRRTAAEIAVIRNAWSGLDQLAESKEVSDDGRRYVFLLRAGARWSDGSPVTASDFITSWKRLRDRKTHSEYASLLENVSELRAPTSRELEVRLYRPDPLFTKRLDHFALLPLKGPLKFTEPLKLLTNGPYRLTEWQPRKRVALVRDPDYVMPSSGPDAVVLQPEPSYALAVKLFNSNSVDIVFQPRANRFVFEGEPMKIKDFDSANTLYLGFNLRKGHDPSLPLRRAIAAALDRAAMIRDTGLPLVETTRFVPASLGGAEPTPLEKAAGAPELPTRPLKLVYMSGVYDELAELVALQLKAKLGLVVRLQAIEPARYFQTIAKGRHDMTLDAWWADEPDAHSFLKLFESTSPLNVSGLRDAEFDALASDSGAEAASRAEQRLLRDDVALVPLFSSKVRALLGPRIESLDLDPKFPRLIFSAIRLR